MKNQYFGDVNDYAKYCLLRTMQRAGFRVTTAWMLTPDDGSSDGERRHHLDGARWRKHDPELFDWLQEWAASGAARDVRAIEASGLVGSSFVTEILEDRAARIDAYFDRVLEAAEGSDLVFLDPDNGLEVQSCRRGTARASKYAYWCDVRRLFEAGHSVLVYQHRPRIRVDEMLRTRAAEARREIGDIETVLFARGQGEFFLFARDEHRERVQEAIEEVSSASLFSVMRCDGEKALPLTPDPSPRSSDSGFDGQLRRGEGKPRRPRSSRTTEIGFVNRNGQEVVRATGLPGTDHGQYIYEIVCTRCSARYGANGSDIHLRKCPSCQMGRAGLRF